MKSILKTLFVKPFEILLVIGYIVFEEIIWNTFAKPIFEAIKSLAWLDTLKQTFLEMNRYLLVSVFIVILLITEYMGILSLITIAENKIILGVFIYVLKIPIASFTFWLFELTKPKLLTFGWLKVTYDALMKGIDFLTKTTIYQSIKAKVSFMRQRLHNLNLLWKNSTIFKQLRQFFFG